MRVEATGAKVHLYDIAKAKPGAPISGPGLAASDIKTITFFNTSFNDLDLALVTDYVTQIPNVKKINFSYTRLNGETLWGLATIATLEELDLSTTPLTGRGLAQVALLRQLKWINLSNTRLPSDSVDYFHSQIPPSLTNLQFSGAKVLDAAAQPLAAHALLHLIGKFAGLEHLNLASTLAQPGSVDETNGVSDLQPLSNLDKLTELDLSNNSLKDPAIKEVGKLAATLTALSLAGNSDLTDIGLVAIAPLKPGVPAAGYNMLTKLNLSGTKLTDAKFAIIANRNTQLTELNLSGTLLFGYKPSLDPLRNLSGLTKLDISGTGLNDALFRKLWEGDPFPKLASLDVSGTLVTDKGLINESVPSVGFPSLKPIYCADTKITTGGVNRRNAVLASIWNASHAALRLSCPDAGAQGVQNA